MLWRRLVRPWPRVGLRRARWRLLRLSRRVRVSLVWPTAPRSSSGPTAPRAGGSCRHPRTGLGRGPRRLLALGCLPLPRSERTGVPPRLRLSRRGRRAGRVPQAYRRSRSPLRPALASRRHGWCQRRSLRRTRLPCRVIHPGRCSWVRHAPTIRRCRLRRCGSRQALLEGGRVGRHRLRCSPSRGLRSATVGAKLLRGVAAGPEGPAAPDPLRRRLPLQAALRARADDPQPRGGVWGRRRALRLLPGLLPPPPGSRGRMWPVGLPRRRRRRSTGTSSARTPPPGEEEPTAPSPEPR